MKTHNERTVPIVMAECIAHARIGHIFTSALNSDVTIVFLPRFPERREHFGRFITWMGFQDLFAENGGFGGKIGEGVTRYLTNSFVLLAVRTSVPILVKIDEEMRP